MGRRINQRLRRDSLPHHTQDPATPTNRPSERNWIDFTQDLQRLDHELARSLLLVRRLVDTLTTHQDLEPKMQAHPYISVTC